MGPLNVHKSSKVRAELGMWLRNAEREKKNEYKILVLKT
jgi:hypothetical protein